VELDVDDRFGYRGTMSGKIRDDKIIGECDTFLFLAERVLFK